MNDTLLKESGDVRADMIVSMAIRTANAAVEALDKANRLIEMMMSNINRYDKELYKVRLNFADAAAETDGDER